ncbi:FAD-dependent oxidoreductase [Methanocaldococcus indicus]|uniref:FAD-dependent oxidoreductase n=1 Tax=Methanocaldococcus indicus TaxID=213231 RepID=UPI003C6D3443
MIGVIGGGISGLLSALALEREGYDVILFEKDKLGGLCRSYRVDGYQVDTGVHAITMLNNGPLIRLLKKYSYYMPNFQPYGSYYIRENGLYEIPVSLDDWITFPVIPKKDKALIISKMIDLLTTGFEKNISVYDVIKDLNLSDTTIKFFNTICLFLSGENMKNTPLWRLFTGAGYIPEDDILPFIYKENFKINPLKSSLIKKIHPDKLKTILKNGFLKTIKDSSKKYLSKFISGEKYSTQGYPLGGIQSITNCIVNSLNKTKIVFEEVIRIEKESNKYIITTTEDNYTVDKIIYSAPSKNLPDIAKIDEIKSIEDKLRSIKQSDSLTVWFSVDENKNPLKYKGSEIWINPPAWAKCISNYDKTLTKKGKSLIGVSFVRMKEKDAYEAINKYLNIDVESQDFLHIQRYIPEQASCHINQFFVYPKISDNFYVVGTDADPRSMGITRASFSVEVMLSEFLK